ncbi:MAG: hypothetical protein IPO83_14970 [Chitinophagaceae bacterium]|nr:hypothetical protein [Chitinophagaceae bacterium]
MIKKKKITSESLSIDEVKQLRSVSNRFGRTWAEQKALLLKKISSRPINEMQVLIAYHDCLLFLQAYPENKSLFQLSAIELERVSNSARSIFENGSQRNQKQLSGTGIAFTPVNVAFGFDLTAWLAHQFPEQISIFECGADKQIMKEILLLLLPETEREVFEKNDWSLEEFIALAKGKSPLSDLQWLTDLFRCRDFTPTLRDLLYDNLKIYITWNTNQTGVSRTYARSLPAKIYYQKLEFKRLLVASKIIIQPLEKAVRISLTEKTELVTVSRGILGMLERETDPSTYADQQAVEYFEMGKGISIALYPMDTNRRLPFDSYIGYMAFKNRIPIAYGGGWIFQQRCKIGVNVLSAFRGGESAYLFLQVLRLYHHHYKIHRFIIEPYQIGYKNTEGLKSGAFWFYYRFGFIPIDKKMKELANSEYKKIQLNKEYRTPLQVLQKLAVSAMELSLNETGNHDLDVLRISDGISKMINNRFNGNRTKAEKEAILFGVEFLGLKIRQIDFSSIKKSLQNFSMLLLLLSPPFKSWNKKEKDALVKLILLKSSGSEWKYVLEFQKHHKLNQAIANYFTGK